MARLVVGPFNRVEGDLEVHLDITAGQVAAARVNSPLYRGFEAMLADRPPEDALVIAPRVCGICSVSHSTAAALALADCADAEPPDNARRTSNLVLACENLADHLTHFYLFFMPDFARDAYRRRPWHGEAAARFRATEGSARDEVLRARAEFLHVMGIAAGKWPHTLAIGPAGTTRSLGSGERLRLQAVLGAFRRFLERITFGDRLEHVSELDGAEALAAWAGGRGPARSDLGQFLRLSADLQLQNLGQVALPLMSHGAYPQPRHAFAPGLWRGRDAEILDTSQVTEDISHSWMDGPEQPLHPAQGRTTPGLDEHAGYTWCKAPRYAGEPVEVGAVARQCVAGHPLIRELAATGTSVHTRVVARLLELARVVPLMERWAAALDDGPFQSSYRRPDTAQGAGLTEAARGALGHWLNIKDGRIANYQIVAPTTWNFSPRDRHGTPGPLEQALAGTPVEPGEPEPVAVQHVVRSFDPCMVCTVH